jgi:hypothetical protein
MATLLVRIFTFLLVLALPLQGFAASRMLFCGSTNHLQTATNDSHASHDSQTAHSSHASHHNHSDSVEASNDVSQHSTLAHLSEQCPACDLCCNITAVPPTNQVFRDQPFTSELSLAYQPAIFSPTLEGLKRPPRATLA